MSAVPIDVPDRDRLRVILQSWGSSELREWASDYLDDEDLIDFIVDNCSNADALDVIAQNTAPEEEPPLLCGGVKTPEEERAAYLQAMQGLP